MCLRELDESSSQFLASLEISRRAGIPLAECEAVLDRLARAGLLKAHGRKRYALLCPVEDMTALDILCALWAPKKFLPAFNLLVAVPKIARRKTLDAIRS